MTYNNYSRYIYYCPICGDMYYRNDDDITCRVCSTTMIESPHEYNINRDIPWKECQINEQKFFEEVLSKLDTFDIDLYNKKDKIIKEQNEQELAQFRAIRTGQTVKSKPQIACPYCKSTNTSKIGVVGRSVSFGLFGFGSSKVGKQWHCNSCKSDF